MNVLADPGQREGELGLAELVAADALLLLLDPPAHLERQAHGPLEVLVGDRHLGVRVEQLEQPVDGLVDGAASRGRSGAARA